MGKDNKPDAGRSPLKAWDRAVRKARGRSKATYRRAPKGESIVTGITPQPLGVSQEERLMRIAPPDASGPERKVFGWLVINGYQFRFREPALGGRQTPGGAVIDFVIYDMQPPLALRIQSYWHENPAARAFDATQRSALEEVGYAVIDIWEWEIATLEMLNDKMIEILVEARMPSPRE